MHTILSILGSIGFNWHVALANFINFLIILFLLDRFFFKKIGKVIQTRDDIIKKGLSQASDAEKALHDASEKSKTLIRHGEEERHRIIEDAKARADALAVHIKEETEKEIAHRLDMLSDKEIRLHESVEKEFMRKAPSLVAKLYATTLKKEMTEGDNNAFIARLSS